MLLLKPQPRFSTHLYRDINDNLIFWSKVYLYSKSLNCFLSVCFYFSLSWSLYPKCHLLFGFLLTMFTVTESVAVICSKDQQLFFVHKAVSSIFNVFISIYYFYYIIIFILMCQIFYYLCNLVHILLLPQ